MEPFTLTQVCQIMKSLPKASSQHLSQGFGRLSQRGSSTEYIELIEGTMPMTGDVFEGIDTSWNRVEGGAEIGEILTAVQKNFNFKDPATHLPNLVKGISIDSVIK